MIVQINENKLQECLEVIHRSFATVAEEFGLTQENCATNGAFIPLSRLKSEYDNGNLMFGLYVNDKIIGFMQLAKYNEEICRLEKLAVLSEYRHNGFGKELLEYAESIAFNEGYKVIHIGIIEKNTRLKNWYLDNGFIHTGTHEYPHLPFTVGFMQFNIDKQF